MNKIQVFLSNILIISLALTLSGCTNPIYGDREYHYERPAIGPTVEDEIITDVEIQDQSRLSLEAADGIIIVSYWDKAYLQIIDRRKLTGISSKEKLISQLGKKKCEVESSSYDIKLKIEPDENMKSFFRRTDDIVLMVPEALKTINVRANSGEIKVSGLKGLYSADISLEKGNIELEKCEAQKIYISLSQGKLEMKEVNSSGEYECGRGDIKLQDVNGDIKLKSVSGNTYIENTSGKMDCDISAGSLTIKESLIKKDSVFYASYGNIELDLKNIDEEGKYIIKAAKGDICLNMSYETGWSILAESTKGRIINKMSEDTDELKTSPTGELYGDVAGGGPMIDAYVDRGNIYLN